MEKIALLSHGSPVAIVAYRDGVAVSAQQFLSDAALLALHLPGSKHMLNVCTDRYLFTVGLAACLMTERVSLLPSTHTPEVIAQLKKFAPDTFCLTDDRRCEIALPQVNFPDLNPEAGNGQRATAPFQVPGIATTQLAAIVFTSGSTGSPVPHKKTWGLLARCVRSGASRLGLLDGRSHTLVGTVPGQHMYGFESTVLLALLSGNAFSSERPFYPADVAASIAKVPQPRVLVTTPIHLRTLLASEREASAGGSGRVGNRPFDSGAGARSRSKDIGTSLLEIYGSTETGQIAMRRTAKTSGWRLWPGVRLSVSQEQVIAHGGHVEQLTALRRCHRNHAARMNSCCTAALPTWSILRANAVHSAI